jgi:hypothetical protein
LTKLIELNLHLNNIEELPDLSNLVNLFNLDLSNSYLKEVPHWVIKLQKLENLNLVKNQLQFLPENIGHMSNLKILNVSENKINELPESMNELLQLKKLDIKHNELKKLSNVSFNFLKQLNVLDLAHNPFDQLPKSLKTLIDSKPRNSCYNFSEDSAFFESFSHYCDNRDFLDAEINNGEFIDFDILEEKLFQDLNDTLNQLATKHKKRAKEYNYIEELRTLYQSLSGQVILIRNRIPEILKHPGILINCLKTPDAEMDYDENAYIQSRELTNNGLELKEYCLSSIGCHICTENDSIKHYFCVKNDNEFLADELFDLMKEIKSLQKKGPLINYLSSLLKEQEKLVTKVYIAKGATSVLGQERFQLLNEQLITARTLIKRIKKDFKTYDSIHEQIEQLIQKGIFYRNDRYMQSLVDPKD